MSEKPIILVSNDDGVASNGLACLRERLADLGEIVVVAPDRERSAQSHAFTLNHPLRVEEVEPGVFSCDGTPADCVYLGVLQLCARRPSLVLSGINHGHNLGADVFYSGTVAAAVEAALRDVPSIALSLKWSKQMRHSRDPFAAAADFAHALARAVLTEGLPAGTLLNVNLPAERPRGFAWTRLGRRVYREVVEERKDPRGRRYYWIGGPVEDGGEEPGSDAHAINAGLASVTPLDLDLTHDHLLERLPGWSLPGFESVLSRDLGKR